MQATESRRARRPARSDPPSLGSALEHTYEAGQQYVNDRLELALLDLQRWSRRVAVVSAVSGAGAALAALGWIAVMAALVLWDGAVATETRLLAIGVAHLLAGGAALGVGLRRARREREAEAAAEEAGPRASAPGTGAGRPRE